jgi:hypothetical protein
VLGEYTLYRRGLDVERFEIGELHLGGGTPTFLTVEELDLLLTGVLGASRLRGDAVLGVEVDPRVTTREQLELMARHGFRRISLGVQDFDPTVQDIVNRVQSEEQVRAVTEQARALDYDSVNYDLIYGLPLQTLASIEQTMDAVCRLRPDRIALYGYAHVPWIKPGQPLPEMDLPEGEAKRALYERSRERLEREGYREIGLDHFALETDSLWQAARDGKMHRNFMGYTPLFTQPLLGLGASSIGDAGDAFAQNEKELQAYQERIARGELPIQRGHVLDARRGAPAHPAADDADAHALGRRGLHAYLAEVRASSPSSRATGEARAARLPSPSAAARSCATSAWLDGSGRASSRRRCSAERRRSQGSWLRWFSRAVLAVNAATTALFFFAVTRGALLVRRALGPADGAAHVYPLYSNIRLIRLVDFNHRDPVVPVRPVGVDHHHWPVRLTLRDQHVPITSALGV